MSQWYTAEGGGREGIGSRDGGHTRSGLEKKKEERRGRKGGREGREKAVTKWGRGGKRREEHERKKGAEGDREKGLI